MGPGFEHHVILILVNQKMEKHWPSPLRTAKKLESLEIVSVIEGMEAVAVA